MIWQIPTTLILMGLMVGCDIDDYEPKIPTDINFTHATVNNYDSTIFGVTRDEYGANGGYQIYNFGTGVVVGFIQPDTMVNNLAGENIGLCKGATVTDFGVSGDCILPKPKIVEPEITKPTIPCPDTRDGTMPNSSSPSVCNEHGYFHCSLSGGCLNKPSNVPWCGEIGSEQRRRLNGNK